jgi:hypothetical protein
MENQEGKIEDNCHIPGDKTQKLIALINIFFPEVL